MKRIAIVLLIGCLFSTALLSAQEFEHISSTLFHDIYTTVATVGDYVYCGGVYGLQIFSVADSANPVFLKNCDIPRIGKIVVEGTRAYMMKSGLGYEADLRIYDISNPLDPNLLGDHETIHYDLIDMEIYDNIVFIAEDWHDPYNRSLIEVIDAFDPSNIITTDSLLTQYWIPDIFIRDGLLHVLSSEYDFWNNIWDIYDLSNPTNPDHLSSIDFGAGHILSGISSLGSYAYIISFWEDYIYDISEPANPVLTDGYLPASDGRIIIEDEIGYLYDDLYGNSTTIWTVDFSDPLYPELMGSLYNLTGFIYVYISGDTSFSLSEFGFRPHARKLDVIDFSDLYDPGFIGHYYPPGGVYDVQLYENYAYIANGISGLQVIDISNPENPVLGNQYDNVWGEDIDIYIDGHYAYLAYEYIGLKIFDLTNPPDPVQIGIYDELDEIRYIFADSTFAYIIAYQSSAPAHLYVSMLDISDPSDPFEVNSIHGLYWPKYIHVVGNYAYISCRYGMEIFDVSDPYSINRVGYHEYLDRGNHLFVEPPYAYVASSPRGLEIIDVSDPEHPYLVGSCDSLSAYHVSVRHGYAYLSGNNKLQLIDISNPAAPAVISVYSPSGDWLCGEVFLRGDYIYDAAHSHFQILKLTETGIEEVSTIYAKDFSLFPNYPNPFNTSTTIEYSLPQETEVSIEIYDILGRKVETLASGKEPAGSHSIVWEAGNTPSGVYFYRIRAGGYSQTHKCVLLK